MAHYEHIESVPGCTLHHFVERRQIGRIFFSKDGVRQIQINGMVRMCILEIVRFNPVVARFWEKYFSPIKKRLKFQSRNDSFFFYPLEICRY